MDNPAHNKDINVPAWFRGVEGSLGGAGISSEDEVQVYSWPCFPCPGSAVGLCIEEVCGFVQREATMWWTTVTSATYPAVQGQIKQAGSQLELSRDSKKEVAVSC